MSTVDICVLVVLGLAIVLIVLTRYGMKGKDQFSDDNDQGH